MAEESSLFGEVYFERHEQELESTFEVQTEDATAKGSKCARRDQCQSCGMLQLNRIIGGTP